MLDVYVYKYGTSKYAWRYPTGVAQKLCKTQEEAIDHARQKNPEAVIYVEQKDGKFKKLKDNKRKEND